MTWKEFRELTQDIPDEEEVIFCAEDDLEYYPKMIVDKETTLRNFTNDNTICLWIC